MGWARSGLHLQTAAGDGQVNELQRQLWPPAPVLESSSSARVSKTAPKPLSPGRQQHIKIQKLAIRLRNVAQQLAKTHVRLRWGRRSRASPHMPFRGCWCVAAGTRPAGPVNHTKTERSEEGIKGDIKPLPNSCYRRRTVHMDAELTGWPPPDGVVSEGVTNTPRPHRRGPSGRSSLIS